MIEVIVYSRDDCHLCEEAIKELQSLQSEIPHRLSVIDIDSDLKLLREYMDVIPVIKIGPYTLKAPIENLDLKICLKAAHGGEQQNAAIDQAIADGTMKVDLPWTRADKISYWFSKHYLAFFNLFFTLYIFIPTLAPVLMKVDATGPAHLIYKVYGAMCHQFAFRSWFLFGEQAAYPRVAAKYDSLISYEQATNLDGSDILAARNLLGNETLGFKIALCQRDIGIYVGLITFGLLYALVRSKIPGLPWYLWLILGVLPIALDGFIQLLSQPPYSFLSYYESTPVVRSITGFLFGFTTAWFGYPAMDRSMKDTEAYLEAKYKRHLELSK